MAKYAILIYEDQARYATMSPEAWGALIESDRRAYYTAGGRVWVMDLETATTIKGAGTVTDVPFVETKEALGGFYVVEARDLDHAVEIAKLCPAPGGGVEVRPVVDPTTNPF